MSPAGGDRLQGRGIRGWLDAHQLLSGDNLHEGIDQGIRGGSESGDDNRAAAARSGHRDRAAGRPGTAGAQSTGRVGCWPAGSRFVS